MTNQEAIALLKIERDHMTPTIFTERVEAMDMAISALQAQDSPKPKAESVQNVQNEDLISRKTAIDALDCINGVEEALRALPSAQPEPCDDAVSRKAAIDAALSAFSRGLLASPDIRKLPSVQPEPHWIPVSERLPSKEERKEWIDKNLGGIGYLYPCLVTRYSSINPDRTKNNPYVAKHYYDGDDFVNNGEEVCSEYIIAWMPLPEPYRAERRTDE